MSQGMKARGSTAFAPSCPVFGAYHAERGLVLLVEANNMEEARGRVAHVAHLVRIQQVEDLAIRLMDTTQDGIPTFFRGYFEQGGNDSVLNRIGPSSMTIQ
jgi:hypothetical protein